MKVRAQTTLLGGAFTILFATACCWLPALLLTVGAGTGLLAISEGLQEYSTYLMLGGAFFVLIGSVQLYNRKFRPKSTIITHSTITCPECQHTSKEEMPTNACQYFYECSHCKQVIKPRRGDCCVYCSYGDVPCPPIQTGMDCC